MYALQSSYAYKHHKSVVLIRQVMTFIACRAEVEGYAEEQPLSTVIAVHQPPWLGMHGLTDGSYGAGPEA